METARQRLSLTEKIEFIARRIAKKRLVRLNKIVKEFATMRATVVSIIRASPLAFVSWRKRRNG
jgi:hypothetical protein